MSEQDDYSGEAPEPLWRAIQKRHKLTTCHIFSQGDQWRIFAFRQDPKGYQASVEQGIGDNIVDALTNLDDNFAAGPARKNK